MLVIMMMFDIFGITQFSAFYALSINPYVIKSGKVFLSKSIHIEEVPQAGATSIKTYILKLRNFIFIYEPS